MPLRTRILLLMLLITVGTSATLAWIVTLNFTRYETRRADEKITLAIGQYMSHLQDRHRQIQEIVRALLDAPVARQYLQAADETGDAIAIEQLKQEIFGRTVQTKLESADGNPSFHVLVNLAGEVLLAVSPNNANLEKILASNRIHWPVDVVTNSHGTLTSYYISTPVGLFLAMGLPLYKQLDQPPSHAYFVGFRVNDQWVRQQLVSGRASALSSDAPLSAWFLVDGNILAKASADPSDDRVNAFAADRPLPSTGRQSLPAPGTLAATDAVEFTNAGERYVGQTFDLHPADASTGRLVLASSLDQALLPLRSLQKQIVLCTILACCVALIACRSIARGIARPIQQLVTGTQRIAAGKFDELVVVRRRDELGILAHAFNQMAYGLKDRDLLQVERTKIESDLTLARKIQMDVLPKNIPSCPGYDIAAYSLPAEHTGGDIYDLVALAVDKENPGKPDSLVLLLADATGHGIGPALSVTQVRAMLRIGVRLKAALDHVFAQINRQLCQDLGAGRFVTAFLGVLDPTTHRVDYRSAGQGPLLHFRARDRHFHWLDSTMLPLGIEEDPQDSGVQQMILEPGDLVILLTDGFYELQNRAGEPFDKERVADIILAHHKQPAQTVLAELLRATDAFADGAPQLDDMTALIIKRQSPPVTTDHSMQHPAAPAAL